eukprot:831959-Prymnesium_polylepis.1
MVVCMDFIQVPSLVSPATRVYGPFRFTYHDHVFSYFEQPNARDVTAVNGTRAHGAPLSVTSGSGPPRAAVSRRGREHDETRVMWPEPGDSPCIGHRRQVGVRPDVTCAARGGISGTVTSRVAGEAQPIKRDGCVD